MTGRGGAAPQNDSSFVILSPAPIVILSPAPIVIPSPAPLVILSPSPLVILSEAKNLPSRLKDMVRKILRRFRSSE